MSNVTPESEISEAERAREAMLRLDEDRDRKEVDFLDMFFVFDSDPDCPSQGSLFVIVPPDSGPRDTNWDSIMSTVMYEAYSVADRINTAPDLCLTGEADSPLLVTEDLCSRIRDLMRRITGEVSVLALVTPRFRVIAGDMGGTEELHIGIRGANANRKTQALIAYQLLQELQRPFRFLIHQQFIPIEEGDTEASIADKIPPARGVLLVAPTRMLEAAQVFEQLARLLRLNVKAGRMPRWVCFNDENPRAIAINMHGVAATFVPLEREEQPALVDGTGESADEGDHDDDEVDETRL